MDTVRRVRIDRYRRVTELFFGQTMMSDHLKRHKKVSLQHCGLTRLRGSSSKNIFNYGIDYNAATCTATRAHLGYNVTPARFLKVGDLSRRDRRSSCLAKTIWKQPSITITQQKAIAMRPSPMTKASPRKALIMRKLPRAIHREPKKKVPRPVASTQKNMALVEISQPI
jgi:hypothetical protein